MRHFNTQHPMNQVDMIAKLADLQEQNYRTTLALTAILELLTEKGILTEQEIRAKAAELDTLTPREANPTW
jgi:hypothetical protein